jgi:hypothetical protein
MTKTTNRNRIGLPSLRRFFAGIARRAAQRLVSPQHNHHFDYRFPPF